MALSGSRYLLPALLLVVGLVIGCVAGYAIASGKARELESSLSKLEQEYKSLQEKHEALQANYSSLQSSYAELESKYAALKSSYESVKEERNALTIKLEELKAKYKDASSELSRLRELVSELESRVSYYESLIEEAGVKGLSLSQITFYDSEPPNASIREPPDYMPGEEVWLYVELSGFKYEEVDGKYRVNIDWYLQVFDEFGRRVLEYGPLNLHEEYDFKPDIVWFKATVTIDTPGAYIAVVTAYDRLSLKTASAANVFFIVPSMPPP